MSASAVSVPINPRSIEKTLAKRSASEEQRNESSASPTLCIVCPEAANDLGS